MEKYCKKCEKEVEPVLESFNSQFDVEDKTYKYRAYRGYCPECNSLLDNAPIQDAMSREKAYKNEKDTLL